MGEIAEDVVSLAELQMELCKVDTRDALGRLAAPVMLMAAAAVLALGTIPVMLLFVAQAMVALTGASQWLALLIAADLGFAAAAILVIVGRRRLVGPPRLFDRSREEWKRNVQWMKRVPQGRASHHYSPEPPPLPVHADCSDAQPYGPDSSSVLVQLGLRHAPGPVAQPRGV